MTFPHCLGRLEFAELFLYLQTTLAVFDPLRQELRDEIALEAFNRMAICLRVLHSDPSTHAAECTPRRCSHPPPPTSVMTRGTQNMVYNNDAKRINRAAIQSLDNDLRYAEGYIRQWNVSSLQNSIQELRQVRKRNKVFTLRSPLIPLTPSLRCCVSCVCVGRRIHSW
jgi:hypothetical protein